MTPYDNFITEEEQALNELLKVYYNKDVDADQRINEALQLGNKYFGTDYAIISHVLGDTYTIIYCDCEDKAISVGQTFDVNGTYCIHTLNAMLL